MNNEETLWMGDLESWMNESFIMNSFIEIGIIPKSIKLIIDKRPNKNKNFCFITFNNVQEANYALFKLNGKKIPKTRKFFKLNLTRKSSENKKIIFVGNLSNKICDNELYEYFKSKYSSVISATMISYDGKSMGYGFVHFTDEVEYQKCLKEMDGKLLNDCKINVRKKNNTEQMNNKYNNISSTFIPNNKLNLLKSYNQNNIIVEHKYILKKDSSNISSQNKEKNSLSLNLNDKKNNFIDNIKLLESDDNIALKELRKKIQESVDKVLEFYKNSNKINEISKIILYYSSSPNI